MKSIDFEQFYIASLYRTELESLSYAISDILWDGLGDDNASDGQLRSFRTPIGDGAISYLAERVCWMLQKVFVAELHRYAAAPERREEPHCDDERAVFAAYVEAASMGELAAAIRERHAFLFERINRACAAYIDFLRDHAAHLRTDLHELNRLMIKEGAHLRQVAFGRGDPHRGARTTVVYRFDTGDIYYKPRCLALDLLFARVQALVCPALPAVASISGPEHGWQAGIAGAPVGEVAATTFYDALGRLTAVAHALCGSDIHFENIVTDAQGYPYFIDLEALFTNASRANRQPQRGVVPFGAELELDRRLGESVMSVGVVSLRRSREGQFSGAAQANQVVAPVTREVAVDARTSRMRMMRIQTPMEITSPIPSINGIPAAFRDYFSVFAAAYRQTSSAIACQAEEIGRMFEEASALRSRQVLRHTYLYSLFQSETTHPAYTNSEGTGRLLSKMRAEEKVKPYLQRIFEHEVAQMLIFDAPYFDAGVDETALGVPEGIRLDGFFERSALALSCDRIASMADSLWIDRQLAFVAAAYGISACACGLDHGSPTALSRLRRQAIIGDADHTVLWTYSPPADMPNSEFVLTGMGPDLYTGLAGVLSFLLRAYKAQPEKNTEDLLRNVVSTARRMAAERGPQLPSGAYTGAEGMLLALSDAGRWLDEDTLVEEAIEAFLGREAQWDASRHDIMDGTAGHILIALGMYRHRPDPRLLELAHRLARALVEAAIPTDDGVEWMLHSMGRAVTGFAHGGCGIAYALAEAAIACSDPALADCAGLALRREDAFFNAEAALWRDMRQDTESYALGWCNGAAGSLLARAACWYLLDEPQRAYALAAFHRSCEWFDRIADDSICHGTAGLRFALTEVAARLGMPIQPLPLERPEFRSGWSNDPDNLGLMVGILGADTTFSSSMDQMLCPMMLLRPHGWLSPRAATLGEPVEVEASL
jgi:lantibiotic modifying enzyme